MKSIRRLRPKVKGEIIEPDTDRSETVKVGVRVNGAVVPVEISRAELVRRAMSTSITKQVLNLVHNHHVTEAGRRVKLEHQWKQIYADPSTDMRIIAAAQRGKTLYQLVKTFAQLSLGMSVGWVMPKENKVLELVHGKLNLTIKNTPLYQEMMQVSAGNDTVKFKTFGRYGKLYIVTANSPTELTSFSSDAMHVDERDFCNRVNLPMYTSRMNASPYKLTDEISTPTVEGTKAAVGQRGVDNIHSEFLHGDQHRYFSTCPHCGHTQILDWFENVVKVAADESGRVIDFQVRDQDWSPGSMNDIRTCCARAKCGRPFNRLAPGQWTSLGGRARLRTYWVEPLALSMGPTLEQMLDTFRKSLGNPTKMQTFMNMDLGRPYAGGMARFSTDLFERCEDRNLGMLESCDGPCTMGIDVNRPWLDVQISKWVEGRQIKIHVAKVQGGVVEVLRLMERFKVVGAVIDTHPETKFAVQLQADAMEKLKVPVVRCKYASTEQGKPIVISEQGEGPLDPPRLITVQRTFAIDSVYETMQTKQVVWFRNWRGALNGALVDETCNPVRKLVINDAGNERFVWEGQPDHQLHASVYDWLAGEILEMRTVRDYSDVMPLVSDVVHPRLRANPESVKLSRMDDSPMIFRG
jgi:hypothetical protein